MEVGNATDVWCFNQEEETSSAQAIPTQK